MNNYIFDREKDKLIRDEDGELIKFKTQDEVYHYLKNYGFKDDWICGNFFIMRGIKILAVEDI